MASLFRNMPTKRITLICQDGRVLPRLKALINTKGGAVTVLLDGEEGLLTAGDRIETETEDGLTVSYVVTDPGFHPKQFGVSPYYSARVTPEGQFFRTASDQVISVPLSGNAASSRKEQAQEAPQTGTAGPGRQKEGGSRLLFETLRTFVVSQPDRETLVFLINELETSVGTPHYPAIYDAFIQTIADRIPVFAFFIPQLSRLLHD